MNIKWFGQTCFKITTFKEKNHPVILLIDPPEKESGIRSPKLEADILLFTSLSLYKEKKNLLKESSKEDNCFPITGPGEYEIKGVYIQGIPAESKKPGDKKKEKETIYTIENEGIKICHLGKIKQTELTPEELERIGEVDILMVPIGGNESIDAKGAIKLMSQIEPKITIPMYYQIPKIKKKLGTLKNFLKNLGLEELEPVSKLSIKQKDIPKEEAKIIVLEP